MKKSDIWILSGLTLGLVSCGDGGGSAGAGGYEGGVALEIEFPPELIEGTPKPITIEHEEAPSSAPSFKVPEGTVLLSKGKPVTGSDEYPIIGDFGFITDGDKEAGEGYYLELMDGLQWVQIDLGAPTEIYAIWMWHFHSEKRAYHDVVVQISNDPDFKEGVTTVFNNDYDGSANLGEATDKPYAESRYGKVVNANSTTGQYVRLYSNGNTSNDMNHYIEVEVWGKAPATEG